jgi:hypothetical protein
VSRHRARLLLVSLAACALASGMATAPAIAAPTDAAPLLLRLPDLGPSYEHVDVFGPSCPVTLRDADRGCSVSFQRLWAVPGELPGPAYVTSAAFMFATPDLAQAAAARPRDVLASLTMSSARGFTPVEPAPAIGDEAALLQTAGTARGAVVWRSGPVVGVVIVNAGFGGGAISGEAVRLAGVQQARMAAPTPLLPADFDDLEVLLDNPRLDVPVYWLGRSLPGRGRLPSLRLVTVTPAENADVRKGIRLDMSYRGSHGKAPTITVGLQRPRPLADRRGLRQLARLPCARSERVPLRNGHATLIGPVRGCKGWLFPLYGFALVRLPDVTVVVGVGGDEVCCYGPAIRYGLRPGMRRLVRALQLRERRDFTP